MKEKGSFRFRREEHLKGRNEIKEVFGKGRHYRWRFANGKEGARLFVLKNELPHNRICFTFPRGFGSAVERNRSKRLSREAFRLLKPRLDIGYDLIFLVYPWQAEARTETETKAALSDRVKQIEFLFTKAGICKQKHGLLS